MTTTTTMGRMGREEAGREEEGVVEEEVVVVRLVAGERWTRGTTALTSTAHLRTRGWSIRSWRRWQWEWAACRCSPCLADGRRGTCGHQQGLLAVPRPLLGARPHRGGGLAAAAARWRRMAT